MEVGKKLMVLWLTFLLVIKVFGDVIELNKSGLEMDYMDNGNKLLVLLYKFMLAMVVMLLL